MFMGMLVSLPLNVPALSSAWLKPARSYSFAASFFDMADRSAYQPDSGELLAFTRRQRHEHIDLVAARIHDGNQPLAHLLLLVAVDLERNPRELLEIGLVGQQRLRHGVVVGEERDGLALEFLPIEIGRTPPVR